jgi:hypothetical protein
MKRFFLVLAVGMIALMLVPTAAFSQVTTVWKLDDTGAWVETDLARALRTGVQVDSSCNKLEWRVDVSIHASVAQWIHWTLNAQGWEWRVMKPGCYAANCIHFWVASNGDVLIDYEGFADLEAVEPNTHNNFIEAYYSWGDDPVQAEMHGWVRAQDLNASDDYLDESYYNDPFGVGDLHDGIDFKLFSKICVVDCNTACEYHDDATITLVLQQQKPWVDPDGGWATP